MAGTAREEAERLVATLLAMGARSSLRDTIAHLANGAGGSAGRGHPGGSGGSGAGPAGAHSAAESPSGWATGSPECCVCPICRAIAAMRDPSPEAAERLASGAGELATGVASVLRALSSMTGGVRPPGPARTSASPRGDRDPESDRDPGSGDPGSGGVSGNRGAGDRNAVARDAADPDTTWSAATRSPSGRETVDPATGSTGTGRPRPSEPGGSSGDRSVVPGPPDLGGGEPPTADAGRPDHAGDGDGSPWSAATRESDRTARAADQLARAARQAAKLAAEQERRARARAEAEARRARSRADEATLREAGANPPAPPGRDVWAAATRPRTSIEPHVATHPESAAASADKADAAARTDDKTDAAGMVDKMDTAARPDDKRDTANEAAGDSVRSGMEAAEPATVDGGPAESALAGTAGVDHDGADTASGAREAPGREA